MPGHAPHRKKLEMENQNITPLLHRSQILRCCLMNTWTWMNFWDIMLSLSQIDLKNPEKSIKKSIINMMWLSTTEQCNSLLYSYHSASDNCAVYWNWGTSLQNELYDNVLIFECPSASRIFFLGPCPKRANTKHNYYFSIEVAFCWLRGICIKCWCYLYWSML